MTTINIENQLKNWYQIQSHWNDHDNFKFWYGLLYYDGFLYVFDGPIWLWVFQARHEGVFTLMWSNGAPLMTIYS
jgi:hypothetical protein